MGEETAERPTSSRAPSAADLGESTGPASNRAGGGLRTQGPSSVSPFWPQPMAPRRPSVSAGDAGTYVATSSYGVRL